MREKYAAILNNLLALATYFTIVALFFIDLPNSVIEFLRLSSTYHAVLYYPLVFFLVGFSIVRYMSGPNIILKLGHTDFTKSESEKSKYFHIHVINLNWPKWFLLFRRVPISNVSASLKFSKKHTNQTIMEVVGRWATSPEPKEPREVVIPIGRYITLSPSMNLLDVREGVLDFGVALMDKNGTTFCAFNDRNYASPRPQRYQDHVLPPGEYSVDIEVTVGEMSKIKTFELNVTENFDSIVVSAPNQHSV